MELAHFLPYRFAVVSERISQCVAQVYRERFGLSRDEWRVIAALDGMGAVKTSWVMENSTLEKMQVSRAVARLERDGLIKRQPDPDDGRGWLIRLQPAGRALYARIVPLVQMRERCLLDTLTADERAALDSALIKLRECAERLAEED